MRDFIFVNLESQKSGAKPFDGMAVGSFTDMLGRKVTITRDDLPVYVANTKENLQATSDTGGAVVGLPIDQRGHVGDLDAAGWIVDVDLAESGDKVTFYPRWTPVGEHLIKNDLQRFFSPTFDPVEKVIAGGSLTNWPATRNKKSRILLKPLELSMSDQTVQLDMEEDMNVLEKFMAWVKELLAAKNGEPEPEPTADAPGGDAPMAASLPPETPAVVELSTDQLAQIEQRAELRASEIVALKERERQVSNFSREVVGKGLPVQVDELTSFLASLTVDQAVTAGKLFSRIVDTGLIPLATELGHSKVMTGTKPLPELMGVSLKSWLANKGDMAEFFKVNAVELGSQSDYDLSEYAPKEAK